MRCRLAGHAELTLPSNSLFHNEPLGVTALRRSSREIVEGNRPCCRAISRTPHRWGFIAQFPPARQTPGSVPNAGSNLSVGCRPPLETIVGPTAAPRHMPTQPPHFAPPPAMYFQNACFVSNGLTPGRPSDGISTRCVGSCGRGHKAQSASMSTRSSGMATHSDLSFA
jgi:hypothetical protein